MSNGISTGFNWPVNYTNQCCGYPDHSIPFLPVSLFILALATCSMIKKKKRSDEQVAVLRLKYITTGTAVFLYTGVLLSENADS